MHPLMSSSLLRKSSLAPALGLLLVVSGLPAFAQFAREEKASLQVVADRTAYEPGGTVALAARVRIEDHWHVNSNTPTYEYLIPTELTLTLPEGSTEPTTEYPDHSMQSFAFTEEPIAVYDGEVTIYSRFDLPSSLAPGAVELEAALRYQACDDKQCLPPVTTEVALSIEVGPGGEPTHQSWFDTSGADPATGGQAGASSGGAPASSGAGGNLLLMLAMGWIGGLILNLMPCVLPVLSIKVFGLVKSAAEGRKELVSGALFTVAGVVVSFWGLAAAAVLAARAGAAVGWGVQFQQPGFVAFLLLVVVLFSLNMWGLFEIPLPASLSRVAGGAQREGAVGHFFSGFFATLMATPCSAPFLGTAVGFALAQPPPLVFAIFTSIGLGLGFPYLVLAAFPGAASLLPKPGAWMVTFRSIMGFLLAAAAVWLFYVLAAQITPEALAFIQLALLGLALATWFLGRLEPGSPRRLVSWTGIVAAAGLCLTLAVTSPRVSSAKAAAEDGRIAWLAFDEQEAQRLSREEGRLVFVDFTADWCLTCKANERLVLASDEVVAAFEEHQVVPMKGDWTNRDDRITEFLARYGRSAVPFYVLFRPGQEPYPFGELLTKRSVIGALENSSSPALARSGR